MGSFSRYRCITFTAFSVFHLLSINAGESNSLIEEFVKVNIKSKADDCFIQDLQPYMKKAGCSAAPYTKAGISIAKHEDTCISYPDNKTSMICWHGEWKLDTSFKSNSGTAIAHRRMKRFFGIITAIATVVNAVVGVVNLVCKFFCDKSEGAVEKHVYHYPPDITCPDVGGLFPAEKGEDTVVVTWDEPTVTDKNGDTPKPTQTQGLSSGSAFPAGSHIISYKATDNTGLTSYCYFNFEVEVRTCRSLDYIPNGRVVCDDKLIYGATCTYECSPGYQTSDITTRTCGADEQFDGTPPVCEKKECPQPVPPSNGEVICSDGALFNSHCYIRCDSANFYRPAVTASASCDENGEWSVTLPVCIDFKEPVITCPQSKVLYADELTNSTVVTWSLPTVVDNSGEIIVPQQTTNFVAGSRFDMGVYSIEYKATDSTGNAAICAFDLSVELLTCEPPGQQLYDSNLKYNCTHGHIYGSTCTISCAENYEIQGDQTVTCEAIQSPFSTHTEWSLSQSSDEPYCTFDMCSDLKPPKYGALICGTINSNEYCAMSCNDNHGFPRGADPYRKFVCDDQGVWNPSSDVPDCTEDQRPPDRTEIVFEIDFYNGNCSDPSVQESIEQQFIDFINSEIEKGNFVGVDKNNYTIDKVESSCDSNGRRRRRSLQSMQNMSVLAIHEMGKRSPTYLDKMNTLYTQQLHKIAKRSHSTYHKLTKRSTYGDVQTLSVSMSSKWNTNSSSLKTQLVDNDNIVYSIWNSLEAACDSGELNYTGSAQTCDFKHPAYPGALCGPGEKTFYIASIVYCQGCAVGSAYSSSTDDCVQCPLGTYQNQSHQQECIQCPDGMSTDHIGAKDVHECTEICKPGTYSKNGLEPCSLCKHGTYNPYNQSTSCTTCDSTKTTTKDGTASADMCLNMEVLFNFSNEQYTIYNTTNAVNNVTVSMWLLIPGLNTTRPSFRISTSAIDELQISFENVPSATMNGVTHELSSDLSDGHWHHHAVTYNAISKQVDFFFDGELHSTIDCPTCGSTSNTGLNVTLEQVSEPSVTYDKSRLAGFQVVGKTMETTEIKQLAASCYSMTLNTLVDIGALKDNEQVEITTALLCDDDNACKINPCGDHICEDKINGYKCFCLDGYTGANCEVVPDYCASNDCQNGATCVNDVRNYTCQCSSNFKGAFCDLGIVNGGWSAWERWGHCTNACGAATQTRQRTCTQPPPESAGQPCTGEDEQSQACGLEACPECDKRQLNGYKIDLITCAAIPGNGLNCNVSCPDGMMVLEDVPAGGYICNNATNYQWNTTEFPRCSKPRGVTRISIDANGHMTSSMDCGDVNGYTAEVDNNIACERCTQQVTISNCNNKRRRRRSTTTDSVINLQFTIALNESDGFGLASFVENKTVSPSLQEYIDSLTTLVTLATSLQNDTSPLTVTINGVTYGVDQSTLNVTGTMQCDQGSYLIYGLCIQCPVGTQWQADNDCSPCTYGYYQNQEGQLECISCPSGKTTEYIGSSNISSCINSNETTASTTPTTSQTTITTTESITTISTTSETTPITSATTTTTSSATAAATTTTTTATTTTAAAAAAAAATTSTSTTAAATTTTTATSIDQSTHTKKNTSNEGIITATTSTSTTAAATTTTTATSIDQSTHTKKNTSNEGSLKYILIVAITTASILVILASVIYIIKCIIVPKRHANSRIDIRCEIAVKEYVPPHKDASKPPPYTAYRPETPDLFLAKTSATKC